MEHPIVHIEMATINPEGASRFYAEVFGWQMHHYAEFDYTSFDAAPGPGGAFPRVDNQMYKPGDVLIYIGTDDIDGTLAQIQAAGGKIIVPKSEVPGFGWFAIFSDPTGSRAALWSGSGQGG
ncbi:MAG TPA: VOC family protein [Ardenticatenaceae bacterium]|nr:VOC family protein [Ardenticatenaceae bacterium]